MNHSARPSRPLALFAFAVLSAATPTFAGETTDAPQAPPTRPTGWALQGLPILNFNTDNGFGYGGQVIAVDRADGTWTPWRASILLQYFATTKDRFSHRLMVDLPRVLGSQWRLGVEVQVARERFNPYYGVGNTSEYDPGYASCADREALATDPNVCPGNDAFRGLRYYSYELSGMPRVAMLARRSLSGPWQLLVGYRLRFESFRLRYTADELGQLGDSRMLEDAAAGRLVGLDAAAGAPTPMRTSELTAGLQYDTRDVEVSPTRGMFHELALRGALRALGSELDYWGATLHARAWFPLFGPDAKLVAAVRGLVDVMGGEVPVSLMPFFGGLDYNKEAIGGVHSARGILRNRYVGPAKVLGNAELRWTPLTVNPLGQRFELGLAGFLDAGRVWSDLRFSEGGGLKAAGGGGLRVIWNQVFVVRADYGVGITDPTTGFYLEFGQIF